eukprot:scpid104108/ scgid15412/ 
MVLKKGVHVPCKARIGRKEYRTYYHRDPVQTCYRCEATQHKARDCPGRPHSMSTHSQQASYSTAVQGQTVHPPTPAAAAQDPDHEPRQTGALDAGVMVEVVSSGPPAPEQQQNNRRSSRHVERRHPRHLRYQSPPKELASLKVQPSATAPGTSAFPARPR